MLVASVTLRVDLRKRMEALSAIDALMRDMRACPGCLGVRLFVDAADGTELVLMSEWDERRDVDGFLESRDFLILQGMRILLREDPSALVDDVRSRTSVSLKR